MNGGPGGAVSHPPPPHPLPFRLLPLPPGGGSSWDPASVAVTLNVRLDGCICPSEASAEGARIAYSHAVVLDDFIDDSTRGALLDFLLHGSDGSTPGGRGSHQATPAPPAAQGGEGVGEQQQQQRTEDAGSQLPGDRWERRTTDMAGAAPTWGAKPHVLRELAEGRLPAMQEVHARLCRLYPECDIAHLPSEAIQLQPGSQQPPPPPPPQQQAEAGGVQGPPAKRSRLEGLAAGGGEAGGGEAGGGVDCACFVANAAVAGDTFRFHVDADPTSFPDGSPWHAAYGDYFNGEPGRPLLVSLLLYLNDEWQRDWGADTLFLDGQTDTGVFVTPRPGRAVLFDQDIMHRVSPPSAAAGGRPRFSLVWKLALLPRAPGQALCLARPEWGPPASIGSAARVDAVKRQLAAEQRSAASERLAAARGQQQQPGPQQQALPPAG